MAKSLIGVLVVGAVCASLGYSGRLFGLGPRSTDQSRSISLIKSHRVTALGRIEPRGGVIAVTGPPGARLAGLAVREGQVVTRGETIATLDGRSELLAEKAHLEAQVFEAQQRLETERRYEKTLLAGSRLERRRVEELEPREIQAQESKIDILGEGLKNSERELARLEGLPREAVVSQQELDRCRLAVRRARDDLRSARFQLDSLKQAHVINGQRAVVDAEQAEVSSIRLQRAIPMESLRAGIALAEAKLEALEIKAPIDGRVLKILSHPGETSGAKPILQLGDVRHMEVVAEVYETDRKRIREGQRAEVRSLALPEGHSTLHGAVARIGWSVAKNDVLGLDPAADAYARVVEVAIQLDPADSLAVEPLTNLQVDVTITTTTATEEPAARKAGR